MNRSVQGMLFVATDVNPADEADFNQWYDREHVEERVAISGFLSGTRYQALDGSRKYLGLYKTGSLADFTSDAYHAAFTRQTAWSVSNLNKMIDPMRRVCAIEAKVGFGSGSHLAILTLKAEQDSASVRHLGERLFAEAGFISSSLLLPDSELSTPLPKEARENRQLLPMMLIESSSADASQRLAALAGELLNAHASFYALSWQLTKQEMPS
ncbi:hypothetical protein J2125_004260 [Erwinia toletana]|uniref:Uncharacterized protein n=1 Tax=Winslowiella toletana TaxID=92490 RepID=A0ABS4PEK2_9GAMM|nr:DUF4286 family protein [Winslowiella toletana]MBP2171068.1 hypothetical protein [Winslowiella toletana]